LKIYYAKINEFSDAEMQQAMQLLPEERVERLKRVKIKKNQIQSISAGLLLEYALSRQGLSSRELTFLKNADGKPYIAECPMLHYNLSHARDYVALVIDEQPVGIDVEGLRIGYQKLVERFFSVDEVQFLQECWSDERFTKLWTRKESYLKATGYGMRMPLDGFSTLEERALTNEKMCEGMIEADAVYYLASQPLEEGYWLSVCRKNEPLVLEQGILPLIKVDLKENL